MQTTPQQLDAAQIEQVSGACVGPRPEDCVFYQVAKLIDSIFN